MSEGLAVSGKPFVFRPNKPPEDRKCIERRPTDEMLEQVLSGFDDTTGFLDASQKSVGTPHKSPGFKAAMTPEKIDKSPMPHPAVFHPKVSAAASSSCAAPAAVAGVEASPVSKSPKEIKQKEKDKSKKNGEDRKGQA